MKHFILFFLLIGFNPFLYAQNVKTVSNNPNIPALYTDLQTAINEASNGDYIYVHPSNTTYGEITISKSIKLIGGGYYNTEEEYDELNTEITEIILEASADNSTIANCYISSFNFENSTTSDTDYNAVVIEHNYIGRMDFYPINNNFGGNLLLQNNIITNVVFNSWTSVSPTAEIRFSTNVLGKISNASGSKIFLLNNFINPYLADSRVALENLNGILIANNIFYGFEERNSIGISDTDNCDFLNNLCYETKDVFDNNLEHHTDNINDQNPKFVSMRNYFSNLTNIVESNFRLQADSPALGTGTSDSDIGITDDKNGNSPFDPAQKYGFPSVKSVNIVTPLVSDDQIEITIEATYPTYTE